MSYFTAVIVKYETMAYRLLNLTIRYFEIVKVVVYMWWARFCK